MFFEVCFLKLLLLFASRETLWDILVWLNNKDLLWVQIQSTATPECDTCDACSMPVLLNIPFEHSLKKHILAPQWGSVGIIH